mmetsp:Transcript_149349/g.461010  ORF Transcript_149349/g.461010 Transcript_149349/m.461010 type:complete len:211 (-) Transcript_149349:648-1280(-)
MSPFSRYSIRKSFTRTCVPCRRPLNGLSRSYSGPFALRPWSRTLPMSAMPPSLIKTSLDAPNRMPAAPPARQSRSATCTNMGAILPTIPREAAKRLGEASSSTRTANPLWQSAARRLWNLAGAASRSGCLDTAAPGPSLLFAPPARCGSASVACGWQSTLTMNDPVRRMDPAERKLNRCARFAIGIWVVPVQAAMEAVSHARSARKSGQV